MIFDWVEKLLDLLSRKAYPAESGDRSSSNTNRSRASTDRADANLSDRRSATDGGGEEWSGGDGASSGQDGVGWRPVAKGVGGESEAFVEIVHGEAFTDRKSTFQAHLARVFSERQVKRCLPCEEVGVHRAAAVVRTILLLVVGTSGFIAGRMVTQPCRRDVPSPPFCFATDGLVCVHTCDVFPWLLVFFLCRHERDRSRPAC